MKNMKIDANGTEIRVMGDVVNEEAYISLTDIAKWYFYGGFACV